MNADVRSRSFYRFCKTPGMVFGLLMFAVVSQLQMANAQSAIAYDPSHQILTDMARNGFSETVEDLQVKVLGGNVSFRRTLKGSSWQFNQRWSPALASATCGSREINRGQFKYRFSGTETVSFLGADVEADIYAYSTDRRIVAIRDPDQLPPVLISAPSGSSSGGGGGGAVVACTSIPIVYLHLRWEDGSGNWIEYDGSSGRMLRYGNRNNVTVSFSYDANDNRTGVFDHFGNQVLTYQYQTYPPQNIERLVSISDSTNRQVQYVWSSNGSTLDKVIDVRGEEWTFVYGSGNRLERIVDPEGRQKIITLGPTGGVESVVMAEPGETEGVGVSFAYAYDPRDVEFTTTQRSTGGREETTVFDEHGFTIRFDLNGATVYTVDIENGIRKRIQTEPNGSKTAYEYDEFDNLVKQTYADGSVATTTYNQYSLPLRNVDEIGTVTLFEYDPNGDLSRVTEAAGRAAERITEFDFDEFGQLEVIRNLGDANTEPNEISFSYDTAGNVISTTDPSGVTTTTTHDIMGNPLVHTDRRGKLWTSTYDPAGNLTSFTDPLGNQELFAYDGVGNLVRYTDAALFETEFEYDARDNLTAIVDELDGRTEFTFDGNDIPIAVRTPDNKTRSARYDPSGTLQSIRDGADNEISFGFADKSFSTSGLYHQVNSVTYPTFTQNFEFDRRGRLVRSIDELGGGETLQSSFEYDRAGRIITQTDPRGSVTTTSRDALGRISGIDDAVDAVSTYTYDDRDNIVQVTNPRGKVTRFEYDLNDRVSAEIQPLGQRTNYDYDVDDNLVRVDDANGQRIDYGYDDAARLTSIEHFRDAAGATPDRAQTFDYNSRNLLETWDDGVTSGVRTYDESGRLTSETVDYGAFSLNYALTYNGSDTVNTFTDADGTVYTFLYDGDDKPLGVIIPGVGTIAVNSFNWLVPEKVSQPGGTSDTYAHTSLLELSGIVVENAAGTALTTRSMSYDGARNLLSVNTDFGTNIHDYDAANRLTSTERSSAIDKSFTYDGLGNRLTLDGGAQIWQYDDNNRLLTTGTKSFVYDDNGNMVSKTDGGTTTNYFYDVANRLERVEDGAGAEIARYGYDAFSRRVWKEVAGTRTYYFYSPAGLIGEYDDTGANLKSYGYMPENIWGTNPVYMKAPDGYHFYHNDHLGTPYMLTNQSGAITWSANADPFGRTDIFVSTVVNNLRMPGQYFDVETGLHYNYFRTYDPSIGRYLQSDPIGLGGGLNTYSYALQNPVRFIDPTGELGFIPLILWKFAVGAVTNIAWQLATGTPFRCLDIADIAISGVQGVFFPGALGAGGTALKKTRRIRDQVARRGRARRSRPIRKYNRNIEQAANERAQAISLAVGGMLLGGSARSINDFRLESCASGPCE